MNHKTFKLGAMVVYKASDDTLAADTAIIVSEHDAHFLGRYTRNYIFSMDYKYQVNCKNNVS